MNIVFISINIVDPQKGGIQRTTENLADYFESKGHKVWYISLRNNSSETISGRQVFFPNGSRFSLAENCTFFKNFLLQNEIDVLIDQSARFRASFNLVKIAKQAGCKIYGVHHNDPLGTISNLSAILKQRTPKYIHLILDIAECRVIKKNLVKLYILYYSFHFKKYCAICDKFVLLSKHYINSFLLFTGKKHQNKIAYIANSVVDITNNLNKDKENELLFVGRISQQKRVDLLLQVWSKLHQRNVDWSLKIIGDGPLMTEMQRSCDRMNLKRVSFEGFQNSAEYYNRASILCMTSSYEGFPMVFAEAMQYGVIPFAFNSFASVVDIIEDGVNGYLINPFNVEKYAELLQIVMKDHSLRENLSQNAIAKSHQFSINIIGEKWLNLLRGNNNA